MAVLWLSLLALVSRELTSTCEEHEARLRELENMRLHETSRLRELEDVVRLLSTSSAAASRNLLETEAPSRISDGMPQPPAPLWPPPVPPQYPPQAPNEQLLLWKLWDAVVPFLHVDFSTPGWWWKYSRCYRDKSGNIRGCSYLPRYHPCKRFDRREAHGRSLPNDGRA